MLLRHGTGTIEHLTGKGNYIGMAYDAATIPRFDEADVKLEKGDRLLLYTDGIVECVDVLEKAFGNQRLEQTFIETSRLELQASIDNILARVEKFSESKNFADDLTLLAVEVL
jgi:phosphoserine phosphatase RsbU/P